MNRRDLIAHISRLPNADRLTLDAQGRKDSQTLPFFGRELEQIMASTYERQFPELEFANGDVIPIDTSVDEGAETFTWYMYEPTGIARFLSAYAGDDLPEVSIRGAKQTGSVEPMGAQYSWTTRDIRNAAFARRPLESMKATACRRAHDQLHHKTGAWGREDLTLFGLYNHPNITVGDAAASGVGNSTAWADKTGEQIMEDLGTIIDGVDELTNGVERVTRVKIAKPEFNLIKRRRMTDDINSPKILDEARATWPGVTFEPSIDLEASKSLGNLEANAAFGYTANDAEKISLVIPQPFTQQPVQADGLKFKVPTESSTGGVKMTVPLCCSRLDGIG